MRNKVRSVYVCQRATCGKSFLAARAATWCSDRCRLLQWATRQCAKPVPLDDLAPSPKYPGEAPRAIGRQQCACGCGRYIWAGRKWAGESCRSRYRRRYSAACAKVERMAKKYGFDLDALPKLYAELVRLGQSS